MTNATKPAAKTVWTAPAVRRIDAQAAQGAGFAQQPDGALPQGS